jgi:hypothetical protein
MPQASNCLASCTAWARGIAQRRRGQNSGFERGFGRDVGHGMARRHGHRHARAHQVGAAARQHMAAGDKFVDGVAGQHHAVKGFSCLHPFGRVHAADRLDQHLNVWRLHFVNRHQIGQQGLGGHGGNESQCGHGGGFERMLR